MKKIYEVQTVTKNGKTNVVVNTYNVERETKDKYYVRPFGYFLQILSKIDEGVTWTTNELDLPRVKTKAVKEFVQARKKNIADTIKSTQKFIADCSAAGIDVAGLKI